MVQRVQILVLGFWASLAVVIAALVYGVARVLILVLGLWALLAPLFIEVVARQRWPLWRRRVISGFLIGLNLVFWGYALTRPIVAEPYMAIIAYGFVFLGIAFSLYTAYNGWPRGARPTEQVTDIRPTLEEAIKNMEDRLRLSSLERLEHLNPQEGTHSHNLVRYADGSWLEWLNPTNEDGTPDFSVFAVYSNNRDMVKFLVKALPSSYNVEQSDQSLWRDQR